ncbi:hypothetical protein [Amantichitinum ursilacus]|uniref:Uncharacterized protein n=1 Tax=Amantichitinum ursilacus TaxID=857265 RepID=A0A0N0XIT5_9NEIS|nr:hypothetical protein [Amantichitinum ursilacus]KPC53040.1 hypothetical protein WG78_11135 [Amantichitinum ursilacus]
MPHENNRPTLAEVMNSLEELKAKVDEIRSGFPGGDPGGHREYHDALIRREEEKIKLISEVRLHIAKGTAWALLGGSLMFLWFAMTHLPELIVMARK